MKLLRSFPLPTSWVDGHAIAPPGRCYVQDNIERFYMTNYDYSGLGDYRDDIVLLEWDIAISREHLKFFMEQAESPGRKDTVFVAPYLLYENRPWPVWAHRRIEPGGAERWINSYELECEYFGFGMIYLPKRTIAAFLAADPKTRGTPIGVEPERYEDYRMTDQTFSVWHYRTMKDTVDILWSVRPVHLNY